MRLPVLGMKMTLLGDLANRLSARTTWSGSAYFNCTISVMNFPKSGNLSALLV